MTLVKTAFLDIDGTLMDTNYLHVEAWAQAFEEVGARPPRWSTTTRWARARTS